MFENVAARSTAPALTGAEALEVQTCHVESLCGAMKLVSELLRTKFGIDGLDFTRPKGEWHRSIGLIEKEFDRLKGNCLFDVIERIDMLLHHCSVIEEEDACDYIDLTLKLTECANTLQCPHNLAWSANVKYEYAMESESNARIWGVLERLSALIEAKLQ